jgi:hypothetical protein
MARFYGKVGYGKAVDKGNGVHEVEITEKMYSGDVLRNNRRLEEAEKINGNLTTSNLISIVADSYANEHFFAIRYAEWAGTLWEVVDVEQQSPRLILRLGGVYNGPKGTTPTTP